MTAFMLGAGVTHTDWIIQNAIIDWIRRGAPGGGAHFGAEPVPTHTVEPWEVDPEHFWGEEGTRRLVRRHARRGVQRLYWRVTNGGDPVYPSAVTGPGQRFKTLEGPYYEAVELPPDFLDFTSFDPLAAAVDEAHTLGMEIYAWYTGCEDDHGCGGRFSEFCAAHQELCQENICGEKLRGNLSFAFPEVMDYKSSLVEEFLGRGMDGLLLDCTRENSFSLRWLTRAPIRNGVTRRVPPGGYEAPVREAFQAEHGRDPRSIQETGDWFELWWRFKSRYYPTPLVTMCSQACRKRNIPFEVMVRRRDNFETYGLDIESWLDEGLLDAVCPIVPGLWYPGDTHGYYLDPTDALEAQFRRIQALVRGRAAVRWLNYLYPLSAVLGYFGCKRHPIRGIPATPPPGPLAELVRERAQLARKVGADGFIAYESNHPEAWALWDALANPEPAN